MSSVLVKICGVANSNDIRSCADIGINALGFLIGDANGDLPTDKLSLVKAKKLISEVPSSISSVILVKKETLNEIDALVKHLSPDMVQIQNDIVSAELVKSLKEKHPKVKWIKTIKINEKDTLESVDSRVVSFVFVADYILLDSAKGGSGKVHNWNISKQIISKYKVPFILAGGLNLENIEEAISIVNPVMVDLMSSMSIERGVKNISAIKELMFLIKDQN